MNIWSIGLIAAWEGKHRQPHGVDACMTVARLESFNLKPEELLVNESDSF